MEKRYEIFISSTFKDLIDERQIIKNIIIQQDNLATGMESFVGGRPPWHHIEKAIKSCDYYILIMGGFYGSINPKSDPEGLSFTECEFRLAHKLGKEILLLMLSNNALEQLPPEKREKTEVKSNKLTQFRESIMREYTVIEWKDLDDLRTNVPGKISRWLKNNPVENGGWVRFRELKKEVSHKQIFNYLFNRLNPHENISLTLQLIEHLDEKLDSIADVINVLDWLIKIYIEELIDAPIRVYFALSLNPEHLTEDGCMNPSKEIKIPKYRLGISNSKDGKWQQGGILKGRSNIHNVYQNCQILGIEDSTKKITNVNELNIPVGDEGSVIAAPVFAISSKTSIGVVGLNSHVIGEALKYRGIVKELSALFSSLFYAYCNYLEHESNFKKNAHHNTERESSKISKMFGILFNKTASQPKKNIQSDILTCQIRNEIVRHFQYVLPNEFEMIE